MDPNRSSRHLGQHEFEDLINLWHERAINLSSAQPRGRTTQSSKSTPRSSPKRRPLHERSSSQANSLGPTIRIVEESPSHTYNKSSLPTNPRQASEPDNAQGSTLPGSVSDEPAQPNASLTSTSQEALVPRPLQPRKAARASGSTNFSDLDTIADRGSPLFHRYSEASTAPSSPTLYEPYRIAEKLESQREDTRTRNSIQLSIRTVEPSSPASSNDRPDSTELEDTGLDTLATHSPASLQTLTKNDQASEDQSSPNYEVISSSPVQALSTSGFRGLQQASTAKKLPKPIYPPNNSSTQSLATSEYSFGSIDRPLSSSSPASNTHAALRAAIESGQPIAYPVIYPPSSSESHASFSDIEKLPDLPTFPKPIHMVEPANRDQWIPTRLSTIPSESEPRHSQSISGHSGSNGRKAENRTTIASITSSARQVPPSLPSEDALSAPLFRNGRGGPSDDSQEFDEGDDVVGELHSPPLRSQRSFFSIFSSGDSRPSSRASSRRRSTSLYDHAGFMESGLFPAWARYKQSSLESYPSHANTCRL